MSVVQLLLPLPELNPRLRNAQGQLAQDLAKDPAIASALMLRAQRPAQERMGDGRAAAGEEDDSD